MQLCFSHCSQLFFSPLAVHQQPPSCELVRERVWLKCLLERKGFWAVNKSSVVGRGSGPPYWEEEHKPNMFLKVPAEKPGILNAITSSPFHVFISKWDNGVLSKQYVLHSQFTVQLEQNIYIQMITLLARYDIKKWLPVKQNDQQLSYLRKDILLFPYPKRAQFYWFWEPHCYCIDIYHVL